jgi:hypothetical protein
MDGMDFAGNSRLGVKLLATHCLFLAYAPLQVYATWALNRQKERILLSLDTKTTLPTVSYNTSSKVWLQAAAQDAVCLDLYIIRGNGLIFPGPSSLSRFKFQGIIPSLLTSMQPQTWDRGLQRVVQCTRLFIKGILLPNGINLQMLPLLSVPQSIGVSFVSSSSIDRCLLGIQFLNL